MNIKSFFLLGMLATSSGMCEEFLLYYAFGNNNGGVNASNNLSEVDSQLRNILGNADNQPATPKQLQRIVSQFTRQTMRRLNEIKNDTLHQRDMAANMVKYLVEMNQWIDRQQQSHLGVAYQLIDILVSVNNQPQNQVPQLISEAVELFMNQTIRRLNEIQNGSMYQWNIAVNMVGYLVKMNRWIDMEQQHH